MDCVSHDEILPFVYPPPAVDLHCGNDKKFRVTDETYRLHMPNHGMQPSVLGENWVAMDVPPEREDTITTPTKQIPVQHSLFHALFDTDPLEGAPDGMRFWV